MMEMLNITEPSINLCIIAYDKNDSVRKLSEGLVISNITSAEELVRVLTQAIDGAKVKKILFRTPRS